MCPQHTAQHINRDVKFLPRYIFLFDKEILRMWLRLVGLHFRSQGLIMLVLQKLKKIFVYQIFKNLVHLYLAIY